MNLPDPIGNWEIVYHLRLLSVQYLAMKEDEETDLEEDVSQDTALEAAAQDEEIAPPAISEEEVRTRTGKKRSNKSKH